MLSRRFRLTLSRQTLLLAMITAGSAAAEVKFNRDIRPIMSDTCFRCHGPDSKTRMAGLRLDLPAEATKKTRSGVIPIVPGDPDKSAIIARVFADNPARLMPPKSAHKELTEAQKKTIRQWVAEGARYEGHWAYQPIKRPAVPQVSGVGHPVDAFIRERLAADGLKPSPQADKRTLLRRVTLDLTGLPPASEDLAAFLADQSPEAYPKAVDRLLNSPAYAEMQAMRWLDAVRYGDSAGFHGDNLWPAWPYRDYVLRAFRDNKPFDEFTRQQIAGDLLPGTPLEAKIASAYNRLNRSSAEGGIQPKEYLAKYGADRVRTTSTVWLGSTMGCAECHDHKFDPFSAKDFYSMKAFFSDIRETGLIPDRGEQAWGTKLWLPTDEQRTRLKELDVALEGRRDLLSNTVGDFEESRWAWERAILTAYDAGELAWKYQQPVSATSANGTMLTIARDEPVPSNFYIRGSLASDKKKAPGLIMAGGPSPDKEIYTVRIQPGAGEWTALGIDIWQDEDLPGNRLARGADRFVVSEAEAELDGKRLPFELATTTGFGELFHTRPRAAIDGDPGTGWAITFGEARNPFLALRFSRKVRTTADSVVTIRLRQESTHRRATIGRFRVALSSATYAWPETGDSSAKQKAAGDHSELATLAIAADRGIPPDVLKALRLPEEERSVEEQQLVVSHWQWGAPETKELIADIGRLDEERALLEAQIPRVLTTERGRPRVTRVLSRGNFLDESGEIVDPAIPAFLGKLETGNREATRLDLANWIVSPDNPLTARVFANRMWRQLFGAGLSKVLEDLGSQGELPSHPELLDWLAAEFQQPAWQAEGAHPWDVRHLIRTIVTSEAYQQSSLSSPGLDAKDPDNRLIARQSRFRVDAEVVHDVALSVSGLLVNRFGGPSVKPVQPEGYLGAMNFPKREYSASIGPDLHRRALYTQWQRTFLHPSLLTFDAPTREECTVNRSNSNTPLQALVLLNDPIFIEAAAAFAAGALREQPKSKPAERIQWAFERALDRQPSKQEQRILLDLYKDAARHYKLDQKDAAALAALAVSPAGEPGAAGAKSAELAVMTTVTRAILNLHETITRN